jgi:hypothetical protein
MAMTFQLPPLMFRRERASVAATSCPACGKPVWERDHAIRLHADLFHAGCALYSPRRREIV